MLAPITPAKGPNVEQALTARTTAPPRYEAGEEGCVGNPLRPEREKYYHLPALGYVLSGWFDYRAQTGSATAVPGMLIFGNAGEHFHCRHNDTLGNRRLVAVFNNTFLEEIAEACGLDNARFRTVATPPGKAAAASFGRMRRLALKGPGHDEAAYMLAAGALQIDRPGSRTARVPPRNQRRILSAVRHIETAYEQPCELKTLASLIGLSPYYFLRLFKRVTGQSPNQYVICTRLRRAADRLLVTKAPIATVAFDVGFKDISHFNACFRVVFGCSPRQWRSGSKP